MPLRYFEEFELQTFGALQTVLMRVEHQGCLLDAIMQRLHPGTIHSAENDQDAHSGPLKVVAEFEDFDSRLSGNRRTQLASIFQLAYLIKLGTERYNWPPVTCNVLVIGAPVLRPWRICCWINNMEISIFASDARSCGQLQLVQPERQEDIFCPQRFRR